jgi:ADP-heptose:LPS heptosyltransferase
VLGYPHIVQLAVAGGLVDRVQSIEARALAGFFARGGALEPDLADYFSQFDLMVSYLYDPDGIFRTNVSRCSRAQFIVGPHRPDERVPLHAAKVYLKPLERVAIFDADPVPRLSLDSQPATVDRVALHPGSGAEKKNWPENKWAELVQHVLDGTSLSLILTGGEAEGERLQRLAAALPPARVSVAQSLPLPELARKLQPCAAFIGHDTGISHLSAALGLPGLVLWGETAEEIWRPPQKNVVIVKDRRGLKTLSVSQVLLELTALLNRNAET